MKIVKYLGTLLYTTIFIGSMSIFTFAESSAKYIKNDLHVLNYGVKFKNLTSNYTKSEILPSSDAYTLNYLLSFKRKNNMNEDDTLDSYTININNSNCKIENVYVDNNLTSITDDTISFTTPGEENIDVNISCDFEKMVEKNELELPMNTYGYFNNNKQFLYLFAEDSYKISSVEDYYEEYGWPNNDICDFNSNTCRLLKTNDEGDMYFKFFDWLLNVAKIDESQKQFVADYISSSISDSNLLNKVNETTITYFNNLDGIKSWKDENYYIFEVDDYFKSYAVTDSVYNLVKTEKINFYFYNKMEADTLFLKYVQKYLSPVDITVVQEYLKNKEQYYSVNNIFDLINVDPRLKNITFDEEEQFLTIPNTFYSIVSGEKKKYSINKNLNLTSRVRLIRRYLNSYIDSTWTDKILYDNGLYSYFVNCAGKNDNIFDNYTYVTYENEKLLLHVYSSSNSEIFFEEQYINSNEINLEYDISNSNINIKNDLNSISYNIKSTNLTLFNSDGNLVDMTDDNLPEGEYQSNIGVITVSQDSNKKYVTVAFN